MKKILLSLILSCLILSLRAQTIMSEPFDFTANATNGLSIQSSKLWSNLNSGDSILVTAGSLTYSGVPASTGNKITFGEAGTDCYRTFTSINSDSVFYSFLMNVTDITGLTNTVGGYFTGIAETNTTFGATIWTRKSPVDATKYNIGIASRTSTTAVTWLSTAFPLNQTNLVVASYKFISGTGNDIVKLWVNPSDLNVQQTADATVVNTGGTDLVSIVQIFVRQDTGPETPVSMSMDEIKIAKSYAETLPITLTSFTGKAVDKNILLSWNTASEINNNYFEVKHSSDGKAFKAIGKVNGAGNSSTAKDYSFADENPAAGTNYYQLVQHDFDGKTSSSAVVAVDSKIDAAQLTVYASSSEVKISISSPNQSKGFIQLFDLSGRKLAEQAITVNKGFNNISLPVSLPAGIHFARYTAEGVVVNHKFVR